MNAPSVGEATGSVSLGLRRAIVAAAAPLAVVSLPLFLTGTLGVSLREEFRFGEAALGLAVGSVSATAAVTTIAVGRVVHRLGAGMGLRIGLAISMVSTLGVAVFATGYATLLLFLVVGGLGIAFVVPATDSWISATVSPSRQGVAMGVKQAAPQVAGLLAGLAVPALAVTLGWRWSFAAGAVVALLGLLSIPSGISTGRRDGRVARDGDVSWKTMALFASAMALGQMAAFSLLAFSVSSAVDAGISESMAGVVFAVANAIGIVTRMRVGHLADVRPRNQLYVASAMLSAGALCFALLATGSTWLVVVAIPLAFATAWGWTGILLLAVIRANPNAPAVASSIAVTGGHVGSFVGPFVFGALAARSFATAWLVAAGAALVGAAAMAAAGRIVARPRQPH